MPPKKKSGKKGKKSGKKSGKRKDTASAVADVADELSKEFFILHIKDLERRLVRYQKKYEALQEANDRDVTRFDSMSNDKKQRVQILKKSLEQRGDEIADLRDRRVGLRKVKESEKENYDAQLQQLRTEFQEMKDQLTSENNVLAAKLASLEEFKVAKESLLAKYKSMQEELEHMRESHEATLQAIDKKTVNDRDRLKKEMVTRVNQVAADFRKVSNKQMADTTKRTIRENVSIQTQLAKMADKNVELTQENEEMKTRQRKQRRQMVQLEKSQSDFASRNSSEARVIAMLEEKRVEQAALIKEFEERDSFLQDLEVQNGHLKGTIEDKRTKIEVVARNAELLEEEKSRSALELDELESATEGVKAVLEECSGVLELLLQAQRPTSAPEEKEADSQRTERLLTQLLDVLEGRQALPELALVEEEEEEVVVEPSEDSCTIFDDGSLPVQPAGPDWAVRRGSLPPLREIRTRGRGLCEPGMLQLVPRMDRHIPSFIEKTRARGEGRRTDVQSHAVQTISAAQTVFAAEGRH